MRNFRKFYKYAFLLGLNSAMMGAQATETFELTEGFIAKQRPVSLQESVDTIQGIDQRWTKKDIEDAYAYLQNIFPRYERTDSGYTTLGSFLAATIDNIKTDGDVFTCARQLRGNMQNLLRATLRTGNEGHDFYYDPEDNFQIKMFAPQAQQILVDMGENPVLKYIRDAYITVEESGNRLPALSHKNSASSEDDLYAVLLKENMRIENPKKRDLLASRLIVAADKVGRFKAYFKPAEIIARLFGDDVSPEYLESTSSLLDIIDSDEEGSLTQSDIIAAGIAYDPSTDSLNLDFFKRTKDQLMKEETIPVIENKVSQEVIADDPVDSLLKKASFIPEQSVKDWREAAKVVVRCFGHEGTIAHLQTVFSLLVDATANPDGLNKEDILSRIRQLEQAREEVELYQREVNLIKKKVDKGTPELTLLINAIQNYTSNDYTAAIEALKEIFQNYQVGLIRARLVEILINGADGVYAPLQRKEREAEDRYEERRERKRDNIVEGLIELQRDVYHNLVDTVLLPNIADTFIYRQNEGGYRRLTQIEAFDILKKMKDNPVLNTLKKIFVDEIKKNQEEEQKGYTQEHVRQAGEIVKGIAPSANYEEELKEALITQLNLTEEAALAILQDELMLI